MAIADKQTVFSFEETHKTAYSHGFESIYKLETVDPKTIRKIDFSHEKRSPEIKPDIPIPFHDQLEFDLGLEYRGFMDSFVLSEPVDVLELSSHAEKALKEHEISNLKDLFQLSDHAFLAIKGLGRGHVDEIKQKLRSYTKDQDLFECRTVNFASWLKSLIAKQERKKAVQLLKNYSLDHIVILKATEKGQLWTISENHKEQWVQEARDEFASDPIKQMFFMSMQKVTLAFLIPWMRKRGGIATKQELMERLTRIAIDPENVKPLFDFFADIFCKQRFALDNFIWRVDQNRYACDPCVQKLAQIILKKTYSYFYHAEVAYPLKKLISFVERECSSHWLGFPDGFCEKVIRFSALFRVRKDKSGDLKVCLS